MSCASAQKVVLAARKTAPLAFQCQDGAAVAQADARFAGFKVGNQVIHDQTAAPHLHPPAIGGDEKFPFDFNRQI
jgi:hypothetical protein